jgi:KUP system potassium uptake protein
MMSATLAPIPVQSRDKRNLVVAALGIVFGDIGTSPLYTMKECFAGIYPVAPTPGNILGILSLIFWSLILIVTLKYVVLVMRADNKGEGGIIALLSLVEQQARLSPRWRAVMLTLGLIGASLFYGDGIITPAISVLSAVEGLEVLKPELHEYVIPVTLGMLVGLFLIQSRGTGQIGGLFGPVMLAWFGSLSYFGVISILKSPGVLEALNPIHAARFFAEHGPYSVLAMGGVVLAITGAEALYADMGHFGRSPIRKAWFLMVLPALLLNYFGQGALLMQDPEAAKNPFYLLVPAGMLAPMIVLASMATIIASQAMISGAFSLTVQAIQLGFCPRLTIRYTSAEEMGQIFLPWINWALLAGVVGLVLGFRSSGELAAAYGIAVTGTMTMTTILAFVLMTRIWRWNPWLSGALALAILTVDLTYFFANLVKVVDGGWFPIAVGSLVFLVMSTWRKGRELVVGKLEENAVPMDDFLAGIEARPPVRVPGTAVFLTAHPKGIPPALLQNLEHNKVLHETVVLMTVTTESVPRVAPEKRREISQLSDGMFRVVLHYGFMEQPNVPRVLKSCRGFDADSRDTTFFLSRETVIPRPNEQMALWRLRLFVSMARNTGSAAAYFRIPTERVVELGTQLVL